MKLLGRTAVISGASKGLGLEIAKQFVTEGASVMMCARNPLELLAAQRIVQDHAGPGINVFSQPTDVSQKIEVDRLIDTAINTLGKIDILVANAGIYGPKGPIEEIDWEEWSRAIDINLKGTVLQCQAVLPHFKARKYGKLIVLSGGGATKPMPNFSAYAASKAGVVRFAETLAEETKSFGIDVNTVAPGALNTSLLDEVLDAGPEKVGPIFYQEAVKQKEKGGTPLSTGGALCVFLAASESDGITGRLLSAVWDPWDKLPQLIQTLKETDVYTLRRIVPEDRGISWDFLG